MSPLLLAAWRLWANMAADPARTEAEDRVMRSLGVALEAEGVDLGLPPVSEWGPLPGLARHREMAKTVTAEEMDRQIREAMDQMVRNHVRELEDAEGRPT